MTTAQSIQAMLGACVMIPIDQKTLRPTDPSWWRKSLKDMTPLYLEQFEGADAVGIVPGATGLVAIEFSNHFHYFEFCKSHDDDVADCFTITNLGKRIILWLSVGQIRPESGIIMDRHLNEWGHYHERSVVPIVGLKSLYWEQMTKIGFNQPEEMDFSSIRWPEGLRLPWEQNALFVEWCMDAHGRLPWGNCMNFWDHCYREPEMVYRVIAEDLGIEIPETV